MDTRLLIGAVFFLLSGIVLLFVSIRKKAGVFLAALGFILTAVGAASLITEYLYGSAVSARIILFGLGLLLLSIVANSFDSHRKCSTAIPAKYIGCEYSYKNTYSPVFEYEYENVKYRIRVAQAFSKSYIKKNYEADPENCEVYINPDNPKLALSKNKIGVSEIVLGVLGIAIIGFVVYTVINPGMFTFD